MSIIGVDDYPAVRAAILVDLDANELPDDTISLPIFQGVAEARMAARIVGMVPQPDLTTDHAKNAVIFWTAGLIAPTIIRPTGETFVDYRYTAAPVDGEQIAAAITARGDEEFQLLIGADATADRMTGLAMAHGVRWAGPNPPGSAWVWGL